MQEPFIKEIEELTNGKVKTTIYTGGALGAPQDQYDLVLEGTADIALISTGFYPGVFPSSLVMELPMQFQSAEVASATYWDLAKKYLIDTEYSKAKVLFVKTTGLFNILSNVEIKTLEDMKGFKTAAPSPMEAKTCGQLGLGVAAMPPPEHYNALERGLIEVSWNEWEGAYTAWKVYEVTKYRTGNIDLATHTDIIIMNWDVWNSLSPDIQQAFEEAGGFNMARECGRILDEANEEFKQKIIEYDQEVGNPPIYYLPDDERARWKEAVAPVIEGWIKDQQAAGAPAKSMLDDLHALRAKYAEQFSK